MAEQDYPPAVSAELLDSAQLVSDSQEFDDICQSLEHDQNVFISVSLVNIDSAINQGKGAGKLPPKWRKATLFGDTPTLVSFLPA